eukprot:gnl/TRDRNA2_/TRDRNA2_96999_c0_seq1.p1 gnl/TRDRNA2_/TRDRNA2_96999_c0~~gnl/TRDRNA2_/TRDRNA2_96999_c0_seq1.p1  ORF type:complete len:370 (-),score=66.86 gnl/TRDRNA2_/TRDRNA2_96999_c0_seq1:516-1556(-)
MVLLMVWGWPASARVSIESDQLLALAPSLFRPMSSSQLVRQGCKTCTASAAGLRVVANGHTLASVAHGLAPRSTVVRAGSAPVRGETEVDYYASLGLDHFASKEAIKVAYRDIMKRCHPDVATNQADTAYGIAAMQAYAFLNNEVAKKQYDEVLRRTALHNPKPLEKEGLVKALQCVEVVTLPVEAKNVTVGEVKDFVRDWASMLAYGSEEPFTFDVQADDTEGGARIAAVDVHVGINSGSRTGAAQGPEVTVRLLGELQLVVQGSEVSGGGAQPVKVVAFRCGDDPDEFPFPEEHRLLKAFRKAVTRRFTRTWKGLFSRGFSALFGQEDDYSAYHLRRGNNMASD